MEKGRCSSLIKFKMSDEVTYERSGHPAKKVQIKVAKQPAALKTFAFICINWNLPSYFQLFKGLICKMHTFKAWIASG